MEGMRLGKGQEQSRRARRDALALPYHSTGLREGQGLTSGHTVGQDRLWTPRPIHSAQIMPSLLPSNACQPWEAEAWPKRAGWALWVGGHSNHSSVPGMGVMNPFTG